MPPQRPPARRAPPSLHLHVARGTAANQLQPIDSPTLGAATADAGHANTMAPSGHASSFEPAQLHQEPLTRFALVLGPSSACPLQVAPRTRLLLGRPRHCTQCDREVCMPAKDPTAGETEKVRLVAVARKDALVKAPLLLPLLLLPPLVLLLLLLRVPVVVVRLLLSSGARR